MSIRLKEKRILTIECEIQDDFATTEKLLVHLVRSHRDGGRSRRRRLGTATKFRRSHENLGEPVA